MQSLRRPSVLALQQLRVQQCQAGRLFSASARANEDSIEKKGDAAKDSFKRGAKNTGGLMGQAGKVVYETLKDIGDAAKEIVNDGRAEGKTARQHAGEMVRDRVSGKAKDPTGSSS